MLDPQKTLEREAMLRRIRELDAEIARHERNMREGEARLPLDEQLSLNLRRFIEANIPELTVEVRVGCVSKPKKPVPCSCPEEKQEK
jgi:hypothetical protein